MARTIQQIKDEIILEKDSQTALAGLTSTSQTAIWRLWVFVIAAAIWAFEKLWDIYRAEVEVIAARAVPGVVAWYINRAKEFQYGYNLTFVNDVPGYATIDTVARIVTRAAVVEKAEGGMILKVAKTSGPNVVPLSPAEMVAFAGYTNQIKFAGTKIDIISLNADLLRLTITVYYNPLYDLSTLQASVESAINTYLANVSFGGTIYISKLIDAVQLVKGVLDVVMNNAEAKTGANAYASFARVYTSLAGYSKIDNSFPLSSTINYVTQNVNL